MTSHWAAVGAETVPLRRARKLQRSWEHLLAEGALGPELPPGATAGLRPTIVESWRRSLAAGLDPTDLLAPIEADESEVLERWFEHPLGSLTHVLTGQLRRMAEESRGIVVVTDASGLVLHRVGDEWLKERAAEMNLVEGARLSEAVGGTNGIGTALAADRALQVFAFEHFNERNHRWICSGAPVHDPVSGRTVGAIDVSSHWKAAHPRMLELVTSAARTMERRLFDVRCDQDARLRRRYGDLMTRSTDLLANRDGYVLAGAETAHSKPLEIPEGGGEVVLDDGSVAVAASLGLGEAFLLRRVTARHARSASVEVLERAEKHVRELVSEQAALRQVATLVARESSPDQLFAAVARQVARVFDVPHVRLVRYEPEGSVVVGGFSEGDDEPFPIGSRWPLDSPGVIAAVRQTGRPARVDDYAHMTGEIAAVVRGAAMRSAVASPIVVERRLWGAMVVLTPRHEPLPEDTEAGLTDFTELVATAIANADSREALAHLAAEQAALRRVATMVAQGLPASELFGAVAREVGALLGTDFAGIGRFEADAVIAVASSNETMLPTGTRWEIDDVSASAQVYRTGSSVRVDGMDWSRVRGALSAASARLGVVSTVASPIIVDGRTWGAVSVSSTHEALPPDTEARVASFTELVATAIANAESSAELAASRARIAAAADDERRRVVRDLHDGAQQRQVHTVITLKLAQRALAKGAENGPQLLQEAIGHAEQANVELRELAHGILPAVLTRGGLQAGVRALASRSPVPVEIGVSVGRLPAAVEAAAYFVVAEALTNVAKHSSAGHAQVVARIEDGMLRIEVRDDGVGGASPDGTGLVGLSDRLAVLDGRLEVDSPPGGGTRLAAAIPLARSGHSASA